MEMTTLQCIYNKGRYDSGARPGEPDTFTPHCIVGQASTATCTTMFNKARKDKAGANYLISKTGEYVCSTPEDIVANTTSSRSNDRRAITVEVASDNYDPYAFTPEAYEALIKLAVEIGIRRGRTEWVCFVDKNGRPDKAANMNFRPARNQMRITVHRWFAAKACPGDWLFNQLPEFCAEVNRRIAAETERLNGMHNQPSGWAAEAWKWGIANGVTDGSNPHGTPTREQVIAMIYRARGINH